MPTTPTSSAIRTRINTFLSELSGLVRKAALESVEEVLSGTAPRRRRGPGRPKGSKRRGPGRPRKVARPSKRIRRSAADLEMIAARVLAHVKSNAGHRLEQIGKALKLETGVLKRPVANLLAAKKLRTKGQRRGTMYFAGSGGTKKAARKAKRHARRPAKRARRASKKRAAKRPARRARKASPKRAVRRAASRIVKRAPAHKKKAARRRSRTASVSPARAVVNELAMDAAAMSSALP